MSKNHGLFQNRILRNQFKMAASVMEFKSTTLKNELVKKYCCKTVNRCFYIYVYIPVANICTFASVFQSKYCFGFPFTHLIKKICICPSLTQAVSIADTKYLRPKMRHFQCFYFNLEASFINLMGHKNIGKSIVISKICFAFKR